MLKSKTSLLVVLLAFITLNIYLFATAPLPLPDKHHDPSRKIPVNKAFSILAEENAVVRGMYTEKIVGPGQDAGLLFSESWKEQAVEAGPLPALFLRGTASYLEKHSLPLSLFLGSDYPINTANGFKGVQEKYFDQMKKDKLPKFFYDNATQLYTAMFPDIASVQACVACHNSHASSPKKDWKLGDMMGATTWSFPKDSVSVEEIMEMVNAYRAGAQSTYTDYLKEVSNFQVLKKPAIGKKWPAEGYCLPSAEVFMDSVNNRTAPQTLKQLLLDIE